MKIAIDLSDLFFTSCATPRAVDLRNNDLQACLPTPKAANLVPRQIY